MNITDLGFKFDTHIEFDGDFDGGNYYVTFKHDTCLNSAAETETKVMMKQVDIDDIYAGLMKMTKEFKKHVTEGY